MCLRRSEKVGIAGDKLEDTRMCSQELTTILLRNIVIGRRQLAGDKEALIVGNYTRRSAGPPTRTSRCWST